VDFFTMKVPIPFSHSPKPALFTYCATALAVGVLSLLPPHTAFAAAELIDPQSEYRACMALARSDPKAAIERAGQWEGLGGGTAASHCRAVATDASGDHTAAATLLEDLATQGKATPQITAGLLQQAAQAWIKAGQSERALSVLDAAIKVDPNQAGLYHDRAVLRAENNHLWEAVDDLNQALDLNPGLTEALVLRAAAYRRLEALDLARVDLDRARKLAPKNPDVWLENGTLALAEGNPATAREDWLTALRLAPNSAAATVARQNIEHLDVR
jgi:Flp pilus assembly protein TadD